MAVNQTASTDVSPIGRDATDEVVDVIDPAPGFVSHDEGRDRFAREIVGDAAAPGPRAPHGFLGAIRAYWSAICEGLLAGRSSGRSERSAPPSSPVRRTYRPTIRPRRDPGGRAVAPVHYARSLEPRAARRAVRGGFADGDAPSYPVVRVAAARRALEGIGGDLIWDRRRDGGRRSIVLADVMGHDALAGRVAGLIRKILHGLPDVAPGDAVRRLNDELILRLPGYHDEVVFATGLYIDLDPARGRLRVSNFAHPALLSEGGVIDAPGGLPVGIFESDGLWPETVLSFRELGPRLLAYTDGIVDQLDEAGSTFGVAGLLRVFRRTLPSGLDSSPDRIMASVDRFRGEAPIKDDQSLLAIELGS